MELHVGYSYAPGRPEVSDVHSPDRNQYHLVAMRCEIVGVLGSKVSTIQPPADPPKVRR